jgi:hypothetical protein
MESEEQKGKGARVFLLFLVAAGAIALLVRYGRIPQPEDYHAFADSRTIWRIPNAWNVLSNIPFALVGWAGISFLRRGPTRDPDGPYRPGAHTAFESMRERPAYVLFFAGVFLTAFGSGYYHLKPSTTRLFWDRLPMAIGFTALFAAMIAERISIYWSRMLLLPFVFAGVASVVQWRLSEDQGHGDLRFYLYVQLFPLIALPIMLVLFKPRYSRGAELFAVALVYAGAKLFEHFDKQVWELSGHAVGGHAIKHLAAAFATYLVLDMLKKRGRPRTALSQAMAAAMEDDDDDERQNAENID